MKLGFNSRLHDVDMQDVVEGDLRTDFVDLIFFVPTWSQNSNSPFCLYYWEGAHRWDTRMASQGRYSSSRHLSPGSQCSNRISFPSWKSMFNVQVASLPKAGGELLLWKKTLFQNGNESESGKQIWKKWKLTRYRFHRCNWNSLCRTEWGSTGSAPSRERSRPTIQFQKYNNEITTKGGDLFKLPVPQHMQHQTH